MFKWIKKNLRPSQKIAAISRAVLKDFSKSWDIDADIKVKVRLTPKDTDGDGVPDIDEICERD